MRRTVYGALSALLVLLSVQAFGFCRLWNDDLALWLHAIAEDADNAQAYNSAGLALKGCQQYNEALEYYTRAIQLNPGYVQAWHNRAVVLAILGRYNETLANSKMALSIPGLSEDARVKVLMLRGWIFEQTGDMQAAERDYSAVADDSKIDPVQRSSVLQRRAVLYARTGRRGKALTDWETVLKLPDPFGNQHRKAQDEISKIGESENE